MTFRGEVGPARFHLRAPERALPESNTSDVPDARVAAKFGVCSPQKLAGREADKPRSRKTTGEPQEGSFEKLFPAATNFLTSTFDF